MRNDNVHLHVCTIFEFECAAIYDGTPSRCVFCQSQMDIWNVHEPEGTKILGTADSLSLETRQCPACGWWTAAKIWHRYWQTRPSLTDTQRWNACGVLKHLDIDDINQPLEEVRDYLTACYEKKLQVNAWKLEEVVESVFRDIGYRTLLTPKIGDDGIDVILYDSHGSTIGVQVKRTKNSITAEQIRSFTGALKLGNHVAGIYVATSSYKHGAVRTAKRVWEQGTPVGLMDSQSLFDALCIAQRTRERDPSELKRMAANLNLHKDLQAIDRVT